MPQNVSKPVEESKNLKDQVTPQQTPVPLLATPIGKGPIAVLVAVIVIACVIMVIFWRRYNSPIRVLIDDAMLLPTIIHHTSFPTTTPTLTPTPTVTPTPTPSYLPPGRQTYKVSQSPDMAGPRIVSLTLDPLDVQKKQQQMILVALSSSTPVSGVSVTLYSDTKSRVLPLSSTSGGWSTTWTVDDPVLYRYILVIRATNSQGTAKVIVAPRTTGPIKSDSL